MPLQLNVMRRWMALCLSLCNPTNRRRKSRGPQRRHSEHAAVRGNWTFFFCIVNTFNTCRKAQHSPALHIKDIFVSPRWTPLQRGFFLSWIFSSKPAVKPLWRQGPPGLFSLSWARCCHGTQALLTLEGVNRRGRNKSVPCRSHPHTGKGRQIWVVTRIRDTELWQSNQKLDWDNNS